MPRALEQRHLRLLAFLEERGEVDAHSLVRELGVSKSTLRRDLERLEKAGRLARTFGGARWPEPASLVVRAFGEKRTRMQAEKEMIARAAARVVEPGMVVALDSGTTVWRVAAALKDKAPLTVLTSALAPVEELGAVEGIVIHFVGGRFRPTNLDFVGSTTVEGYRELHADLAIVGADSFIPGKGAYSLDEASAAVAAAVAGCAERKVVVADHSKIDAKGCCLILPSKGIDFLITDNGIAPAFERRLRDESFELIVATGE